MVKVTKGVISSILLGGLFVFCPSYLRGTESEDNNFIKNPGFENSKENYYWGQRNWWKRKRTLANGKIEIETNEFNFELEPNEPHSGKYAQKISMSKHISGDLQFLYELPMLKPEMPVRLAFWIKGPANTKPIKVSFRKDAPPWKTYFKSSIPLTDTWTEHVFNITLPKNTDPEKTVLMFHLHEENTFWLDDVSVSLLPEKEPGDPVAATIKNGSFEVGCDRWYATFRENCSYAHAPIADERNINATLKSIDMSDAPHGNRCLNFEIFPLCSAEITSAFFPLKYGHETTISFWLKTSKTYKRLHVSLVCGKFPNITKVKKVFKNTAAGWHKHSFTVKPKPSADGKYFIDIRATDPAVYYIDNITINQSNSSKVNIVNTNIGWEPGDQKHPANIFKKGEKPTFKINVEAVPGTNTLELTGHVLDTWEKVIAPLKLNVELDKDGFGSKQIVLPANQYGTFKAELFMGSESNNPDVEILYSVPVELSSPKTVKDSYFGGHVRFTPYNLHIAEKAGFRWLRCHPPNDTKWDVVEPEKGKYVFHLNGVKRANAMGFKVLGMFAAVPEFYANKPKNARHNWYHCYPPTAPEGWNAWERYVTNTAREFSPYIDVWEIGNESDGGFLQVPLGLKRDEIYLEYTRRTQKALKDFPDMTLIGGVITGADRPFMDNILKLNVGDYVDALSFHSYEGMGQDMIRKRKKIMQRWSSYLNAKGHSMPIWHSEGYGGHVYSWLKTSGKTIPTSYRTKPAFTAAMNITSMLCFKQIGAKKHFLYAAYAHPAGRIVHRDECALMTDKNGMPLPLLAAHAAAVHFLEGTVATGLQEQAGLITASFMKNGKHIKVMWTENPAEIQQFDTNKLKAEFTAFDMMGNCLPDHAKYAVGNTPVYFVED